VTTARRLAELVLAAAIVAVAFYVNAKVHGIGYHWWPDRVYCQPQDHVVTWWVGRTEHVGCGESLTVTTGARP
jgi:hypothetical protein